MPYYLLIGTVEPFNTPPNKASEIAQRLPSSLERLVVVFSHSLHVGTWDDLDDIILGISESICTAHVNSALPNLKRVELVINDDGDLGLCMPKFNIEAFRSVLASRQVQLDVSLCVKPGELKYPSIQLFLRIRFGGHMFASRRLTMCVQAIMKYPAGMKCELSRQCSLLSSIGAGHIGT
jgi:hypothetical protein